MYQWEDDNFPESTMLQAATTVGNFALTAAGYPDQQINLSHPGFARFKARP
jgi:hypothetical protein